MKRTRIKRFFHFIVIAALAVLFFILAFFSYRQKSATYDEGIIIASGHKFLSNGQSLINAENPPLLKMLISIPILFQDINNVEINEQLAFSYEMPVEFTFAREFLYEANDAESLLFPCRFVVLILTLATGFLLYRFISLFARPSWALLGMGVFLLSPNVIAHGRLATVDLGLTLFILGAEYALYQGLQKGNSLYGIVTGLLTGAAMLSKYTGLLLPPIIFLQLVLFCSFNRNKKSCLLALKIFICTALISWVLLCSFYIFDQSWIICPNGDFRSPLLTKLLKIPGTGIVEALLPIGYLKGFDIVAFNNQPGLPNIFLGKLYSEGGSWFYYYLVVMMLKVTIPTLVLSLIGLVYAFGKYHHRWQLWFLATPPLLLFLNFSFLAYRQLGIRYILPIFPFLAISAAIGIRFLWYQKIKWLKIFCVILIAWLLIEPIMSFPHYISYFNQFAGGQEGGKNWLAASNLDWGQDLPALREWLDQNGDPPIQILYHGQAKLEYYDLKSAKNPKYIAISVTNMYLYGEDVYIKELLKTKPIGNAGHSIYLYRPLERKRIR